MEEKILSAEAIYDEEDSSLRPQTLKEYVGQSDLKENLEVFIKAAKMRDESLDHVLLYGPPGLGKTTMAYILANELGTNIRTVSGPSIERSGDLVAILLALKAGDVLFIDEIHRLPKITEEVLYSAMEDFRIDIVMGKDEGAKSITFDIPPFTLVGATTRAGEISSPLRDRFGITSKLNYYTQDELSKIVSRTAKVFNTEINSDAIAEIASRSRGTPRIANRLFRRVRDFAQVKNNGLIDIDITKTALERLKVDSLGLNDVDIRYLRGIIERFNGGPVGVEAIASAIGEESVTLEDVNEPYLLQIGFINRTARGRIVTPKAYEHLKISQTPPLF